MTEKNDALISLLTAVFNVRHTKVPPIFYKNDSK